MNPKYLIDNYLKEFEATVIEIIGHTIILDDTIFYPTSGGQPNDSGFFIRLNDNETFAVNNVIKSSGKIYHHISLENKTLRIGDKIKCSIDWNRRYAMMKNHTAAHILSAVIQKETGAKITGNQLGIEKSRIDFDLEDFDRDKIETYFKMANEIVSKELEVRKYFLPSIEAFKRPELFSLKNVLPPNVTELRIVEIVGFDIGACGGTHVNNTFEIGNINFLKAENKGKNNRRISYYLS